MGIFPKNAFHTPFNYTSRYDLYTQNKSSNASFACCFFYGNHCLYEIMLTIKKTTREWNSWKKLPEILN